MECKYTGLPIDYTPCKTCGEPITYFVYLDFATQTIRPTRHIPRYHTGHCREVARLRNAEKTVAKYKQKQKEKSNV